MRAVFLLVIIVVISACKRPHIECIRPLTLKEKHFIDSLEYKGYKVELSRFNYPYTGDSISACLKYIDDIYYITIDGESFDKVSNMDSMRIKTRLIAIKLCSDILNDSLVHYTREINVSITSFPKTKAHSFENLYSAVYKKSELCGYLGFVIKTDKKGFYRETISQKLDSLPIFKEDIVD